MLVRTLPNYLLETAKIEVNEVPSQIPQHIQEIRNWLEEQPHLVVNNDENQWILTFLRCCKYNLEETKKKIDLFFTVKSITPEFFDNKDPMLAEMQEILTRGACIPIKSESGPAKILILWRKVDPNNVTFTAFFRYGLMLYDILLEKDDNFVVKGQEILHDMQDFPVDVVKLMTPVLCKKSMLTILEAYPSRIKQIAFFNASPTYELFTKLFEPFLSPETKNKVTIHKGGLEDVYKELPLTDFPKEYGGEGVAIEKMAANWRVVFESHREQLLNDSQYRSDETKRKGGPKTYADMYNIEESFGNLNID